MTRAEILDEPAGRRLDALVAEKVMGWKRVEEGNVYFWPTKEMVEELLKEHPDVLAVDYFPAPYFSTDIAEAWPVLEKLGAFRLSRFGESAPPYLYQAEIGVGVSRVDDALPDRIIYANATTAPLAVCRAALLACTAHK